MTVQNLSDNTILVELHREPKMSGELTTAIDIVSDRGDCDVVVDFGEVDIITSQSLSKLLKLRKLLRDCGYRLVFYNVPEFTKSAFKVTGLDGLFELADDRPAALTALQQVATTQD